MTTRFAKDRGLSLRMGSTIFLNGLLYVVLILAIWYVLGESIGGAALAIIISVGLFFFQWYFSDSVALKAMNARVVSPEEAPELHIMIDRMCQLADMEKPRVAVSHSDVPNAFATGRSPKRAVVCVTTGLMNRLDKKELEAVLAHELSHVAHRDVTVMTVAGVTGVLAGVMVRSFMYGGMGRRNNNNNGVPVWLVMMVVGVLVYALSFFLIRVLSRYRELAADRAAAYLTGAPSTLSAALVKISGEMGKIPTQDLRKASGTNHLSLVPAINGTSVKELFSTHPSLDKRLAQLSEISRQLSRPA